MRTDDARTAAPPAVNKAGCSGILPSALGILPRHARFCVVARRLRRRLLRISLRSGGPPARNTRPPRRASASCLGRCGHAARQPLPWWRLSRGCLSARPHLPPPYAVVVWLLCVLGKVIGVCTA